MSYSKRFLVSTSAFALLVMAAPAVRAQTAAPTPAKRAGIEEVVVTARRRAERAQTTPISVTALSAANLAQKNVVQVSDLNSQIPGFRFSSEGGKNENDVILRGLSRIPIGLGEAAVVEYFDEVPLPGIGSNRPLFDLSNVQVFKGPQGTLFGRNALGGALLLQSQLPTDKLSGYIDGTLGNYSNRAIDGAVNIPIIPDVVDLRISGHYRRENGYVTNENGSPNFSDIHENAYRVSLIVQPTSYLKNTTVFDYFTAPEDAAGETIINANPGVLGPISPLIDPQIATYLAGQKANGPFTQYTDSTGAGVAFRRETGLVNDTRLSLGDDLTIRNIFGYERVYNHEVIDSAATGPTTLNEGFGPLPFTLFDAAQLVHQEYLTDEVQVLGKSLDEKLNWIVGGFYNHDDTIGGAGTTFTAFSVGGVPSAPITSLVSDHNYAIYGQAGLDLSDWVLKGLTFNLGYRYSWDMVHGCGGTFGNAYVDSATCEAAAAQHVAGGPGDVGAEGGEPSWTIGLDYKYSPTQFFYITSRRGYRGVNINTPLFSSVYTTGGTSPLCTGPGNVCPDLRPFQKTGAEKITDVEIGSKTDFTILGMRARFDIDGYYSKYKGAVQFFNVIGTGIFLGAPDLPNDQSVGINAANETIIGSELGFTLKPVNTVTIVLNGAYTNASVDSVASPSESGLQLTKSQITLPSPLFSGSASVTWTPDFHPLGGDLLITGDWFQTGHFGAQYGRAFPGYGVGNGRVELDNIENTHWNFSVFVKNIADRAYLLAPVVLLDSFPDSVGIYAPPRQYGAEARYTF